jgi:hypothetical protein
MLCNRELHPPLLIKSRTEATRWLLPYFRVFLQSHCWNPFVNQSQHLNKCLRIRKICNNPEANCDFWPIHQLLQRAMSDTCTHSSYLWCTGEPQLFVSWLWECMTFIIIMFLRASAASVWSKMQIMKCDGLSVRLPWRYVCQNNRHHEDDTGSSSYRRVDK